MDDKRSGSARNTLVDGHYYDRDDYGYKPASEWADDLAKVLTLPPENENQAEYLLNLLWDDMGYSAARMSLHLPVTFKTSNGYSTVNNYYAENAMLAHRLLEEASLNNKPKTAALMGVMTAINYCAAFEDELMEYSARLWFIDRQIRIGKPSDTWLDEILKLYLTQTKVEKIKWSGFKKWFFSELQGKKSHPSLPNVLEFELSSTAAARWTMECKYRLPDGSMDMGSKDYRTIKRHLDKLI